MRDKESEESIQEEDSIMNWIGLRGIDAWISEFEDLGNVKIRVMWKWR